MKGKKERGSSWKQTGDQERVIYWKTPSFALGQLSSYGNGRLEEGEEASKKKFALREIWRAKVVERGRKENPERGKFHRVNLALNGCSISVRIGKRNLGGFQGLKATSRKKKARALQSTIGRTCDR